MVPSLPLLLVLDTNVLLTAAPPRSRRHPIYQAIEEECFELCVSTAIMQEYEEILARLAHPVVAVGVLGLLNYSPNVLRVEPSYKWRLITADPDDDKFVDCALAGGASHIVTEDRHFDVLAGIDFPPVGVMRADELLGLLELSS